MAKTKEMAVESYMYPGVHHKNRMNWKWDVDGIHGAGSTSCLKSGPLMFNAEKYSRSFTSLVASVMFLLLCAGEAS